MWITLDKRYKVQDKDPSLNFQVSAEDKDDFNVTVRSFKQPLLEISGVSKEQLVVLREQITNILGGDT